MQGGIIMTDDLFGSMKQSIVDGDPARDLTQKALAHGIPPLKAINRGFILELNAVGEQSAAGETFLPNLVLQAKQ